MKLHTDHFVTACVESNAPAVRTESLAGRMVRSLSIMAAFALATGLAAQVRIPLAGTDVPLTLQTLAVMVTGLLLAPRLALGSMSLYLALGIWQIFPFAASTGLRGPTGGYLLGFLAAAPMISLLAGPRRWSLVRQSLAVLLGTVIIFSLGVARLAVWRGGDLGFALKTGLLPFVPEAFLKMGMAVGLVQAGRRLFCLGASAPPLSK